MTASIKNHPPLKTADIAALWGLMQSAPPPAPIPMTQWMGVDPSIDDHDMMTIACARGRDRAGMDLGECVQLLDGAFLESPE